MIRIVADFVALARQIFQTQEHRRLTQRTSHETEIAARIQKSLIPRVFYDRHGCRVSGVCESAHVVGGDFFDILELYDGRILLVIADVMGKGVQAALMAANLRAAIRSRASVEEHPGHLLTEINRQFCPEFEHSSMFATVQLGYLDPKLRRLVLSSAGHSPLMWKKRDGSIDEVRVKSRPLGVDLHETYQDVTLQFDQGESFMMITDGLYEVFDLEGKILEWQEFKNLLNKFWQSSAPNGCADLIQSVRDHVKAHSLDDDQTLLVVQF